MMRQIRNIYSPSVYNRVYTDPERTKIKCPRKILMLTPHLKAEI